MQGFLRARLANLLDGTLLVMVLGSAVAIGAVHVPVTAALAGICVAFALLVVGGSVRETQPPPFPFTFWALLTVALWSLFQSSALGSVLGVLGGDDWERAGLDAVRLTGNLSPTAAMALKCAAAALVFAAAFYYFHRTDRIDRLITLIIGSAVLVAVLGLIQLWLKTDAVLFFYEPEMGPVRPGLRGSFVNPDHFGAYVSIAALLALARGGVLRADRVRYVYQVLSAVLVAAVLLAFSASALLGLMTGLLGLWWASRRQSSRIVAPLRVAGPVLVAGAVLAVAAYAFGLTPNTTTAMKAAGESLRRIPELWGASAAVALESPVVGIGSGSLADALGSRLGPPATSVWFARNQLLQSLVDFGIPMALLLLAGLGAALRHLRKRWHTEDLPTMVPVSSAMWGIVAIGATGFALEIPAVGIVGLLLLGALCAQGFRYDQRNPSRPLTRLERLLAAIGARPHVVIWALCILVSITAVWATTATQRQRNAKATFDSAIRYSPTEEGELSAVDAAARALLEFRPGFGRIYTRVGEAHLSVGDAEGAMEWLTNAVELLPTDAVSLAALAIAEIELGDLENAMATMDEVIALDPMMRGSWVAHLVSHQYALDLWREVTTEPEMRGLLADALIDEGRFFEAMSFASRLLGESAEDIFGLDLACRAAMGLGLDDLSLRFARSLHERDPESITADLVVARAAISRGDLDQGIGRLEDALARSPDSPALRFGLCDALVTAAEHGEDREGYEERVESIREQLRPVIFTEKKLEIEYYLLSARFFSTTEYWPAAATAARHGTEIAPDNVYFHLILALALENLDYRSDAEYRRGRARAIDPTAVYPVPIRQEVVLHGTDEDQTEGGGDSPDSSSTASEENTNDREDRE